MQSAHYRAAVNYTERSLEEASDRLYSLYYAVGFMRTRTDLYSQLSEVVTQEHGPVFRPRTSEQRLIIASREQLIMHVAI